MTDPQQTVLMVDDSDDDRFFMRRMLKDSADLRLAWETADGEEAINYMKGAGDFADRERYPFPDVIILDLKMAGKNGYDILEWLRTQSFPDMIIVVSSGSFLPDDIARCQALGVDAYYRKTSLREEQAEMMGKIESLLKERTRG
jgi:CheY-like chemotaxis protein